MRSSPATVSINPLGAPASAPCALGPLFPEMPRQLRKRDGVTLVSQGALARWRCCQFGCGKVFGLENRFAAAHIRRMEQQHAILLEVTVAGRDETWEWQVRAGDKLLVSGTEATRLAARLAGNDARFLILAGGWVGK
jgi:hypothetical protein